LFINKLLGLLGLQILRKDSQFIMQERIHKFELAEKKMGIISELCPQSPVSEALALVSNSQSQLGQDLLALSVNGLKRNGYFVEFGATDGIKLSNTHLLEKHFNWNGILAEPSKEYWQDLNVNRSAALDSRCDWNESGLELEFYSNKELSSLEIVSNRDDHRLERAKNAVKYRVCTVSLIDLLGQHAAPSQIDFLSIDTEGSEFEILEGFDFSKYTFNVVSVEHNFNPQRTKIRTLLEANGYQIVFQEISEWDDWYIHKSMSGLT